MNITRPTTSKEITRKWYLIDARDQILGRLSTQIALLLMGKKKPYFARNLDCGDYVVVINSALVKVTGKKEQNKLYRRHSGYPGGYKEEPLNKLKSRKPTEILQHAVSGMLPKNKLRDRMLKRLYLFAQDQHTFENKFK
ncbi:50S ribosomal protein L13 [Candidatus Microgenomates bacterium]|nr:50S ribosomal protein L13 [Candidatus Microgenomates bacterium]